MQEMFGALDRLIEVFDDLGIEYAIGGSLASSAWGEPRSTHDVDLVAAVEEHHVVPLAAALADRFYADEELIRDAVAAHAAPCGTVVAGRSRPAQRPHPRSYDACRR